MGFTPTAGLVMGSRCGDLDPSVPLWLDAGTVSDALDHESGLAGLVGFADMRAVLAAECAGRPDAVLAVQVWLHRLRAGMAAMVAALGGIDMLAFSGGIGENAASLRSRTIDGPGFLGLAVDHHVDTTADADVSAPAAPDARAPYTAGRTR